MKLSSSGNGLVLLGMLMGICSAAPAGQDDSPAITLPSGIPPTCIGFNNGSIKTPSCYTATVTTTPTKCFKACVTTNPIMCPMYIKITSVAVPCSTDCCPRTPTQTVTAKCPSCATGCVIPTETITYTTGCKTTPGVTLAPTPTFIIG